MNVVSGTGQQTSAAIEVGCLEALIQLLANTYQDLELADQALWALGNTFL
ncbi:MAG: hypothetical protein GY820_02060 [Gammaproteobacteria bacterium]|nr:hypothetical protein [Gammaproteobacteria bacterium]